MNISTARAALIATILAAPATAAPSPCSLTYMTSVPLTLEHGRIFVTAEIGDHPVKLIVDTGSNISSLSHATARPLPLHERRNIGSLLSSATLRGVGGDRTADLMEAPRAHVGDVLITDLRFFVPSGPRDEGAGPDLDILAMNALGTFDIDFDLIGHRMVLFQGNDTCSQPRVLMDGPLYVVPMVGAVRDLHTLIQVSLDGHELTALVDTGAGVSVVEASAVARAGLAAQVGSPAKPDTLGGIGAHREALAGRLVTPITIGDLSVAHMHLQVIDEHLFGADMVLGMDFLSHVHTWISNSTRKVVFQVPPTASPAVPGVGK